MLEDRQDVLLQALINVTVTAPVVAGRVGAIRLRAGYTVTQAVDKEKVRYPGTHYAIFRSHPATLSFYPFGNHRTTMDHVTHEELYGSCQGPRKERSIIASLEELGGGP